MGNRIRTTELLESPLEAGRNIFLEEFSYIYIGVLNEYDLIASKLFRGLTTDFDDCLMLVETRRDKIDIEVLKQHFKELASYDISEKRITVNLECFLDCLKKEGLYSE